MHEERPVSADDGTALSFLDEFSRCQRCATDFYTHDQSLASSRARAGALREHEGLLTPQEIRDIRGQLGYTQAQLEEVLGVGAKTVVRWEKGTVRQSRLADRFLRTLAAYPAAASQGQPLQAADVAPGFPGVAMLQTAWQGAVPVAAVERWGLFDLTLEVAPEALLEAA
ncbi:MAG: helix-turn-helix domain-containing protein [Gemmatimonadetes bacterium]|nr:helix-turn-helix domain-containing protein [Gemmatimonadota bacterium]